MLKVIVFGESGAGKTSMVKRLCEGTYTPHGTPTIGVGFSIRDMGADHRLQIWDVSGERRHRHLVAMYTPGAHILIFVFDVSDAESFAAIEAQWSEYILPTDSVLAYLVGTKCDTPVATRQVSEADALAYAVSKRMRYFEVSAATGAGVEDNFAAMMQLVVLRIPDLPKVPADCDDLDTVNLIEYAASPMRRRRRCCCCTLL